MARVKKLLRHVYSVRKILKPQGKRCLVSSKDVAPNVTEPEKFYAKLFLGVFGQKIASVVEDLVGKIFPS